VDSCPRLGVAPSGRNAAVIRVAKGVPAARGVELAVIGSRRRHPHPAQVVRLEAADVGASGVGGLGSLVLAAASVPVHDRGLSSCDEEREHREADLRLHVVCRRCFFLIL
jgi:hypothetical protein